MYHISGTVLRHESLRTVRAAWTDMSTLGSSVNGRRKRNSRTWADEGMGSADGAGVGERDLGRTGGPMPK
jgi:hypothetical protein